MVALMTPLDALQRNYLSLENENVVTVVVTHLNAMSTMINKGSVSSSLVNAMLQFSIELLSRADKAELCAAAEDLLATCLSHDVITRPRQHLIALEMSRQGKWKAWSIICSRCPSALSVTLSVADEAVSDFQDSAKHLGALAAVRAIMQSVDATTSPVVGQAMQGIGASCFGLFKVYATLSLPIKDLDANRMAVSTDVMKIMMI
jgi:hypothetical protein